MTVRRFVVPYSVGAVGFTALIGLMAFIMLDGRENHLTLLYAILPVLPGLVMMGAVLSAYREMDERERRIHGEAALSGFLISVLLFFVAGILQAYAEFPQLNLALAAAIMTCAWGIGFLLAARRYR